MQRADYSPAHAYRMPILKRDGTIRTYALVHPDDVPLVAAVRWSYSSGYAIRSKERAMHRVILDLPLGHDPECDHINRNRLDNRRCNLRVATRTQNAQNLGARGASGVRGVRKQGNLWAVLFRLNGESVQVGSFRRFEQAEAASRLWLAANAPHALDAESIPEPIILGDLPIPRDRSLDHPGPTPMLSLSAATAIYGRRMAGESLKSLAAEFGISQQLVCDIAKGRRYREIRRGTAI